MKTPSLEGLSLFNKGTTDIPVVCLMGPTATGKTDAAAQLFEAFDAEIVSVDSSLIYQHMNIGTAKPDAEFLARYPHHLVNIRHPNQSYSVADFYTECCALIEGITSQGKLPVLAGGTMFYFNALEQGLTELPSANKALRVQIDEQAKQLGWPAMHERLRALDAASAARIDAMDAQRIQRALEIVMTSSMTVAQHNANRRPAVANPLIKIGLSFSDRSYLHQRIEQRFDVMLEQGLQAEVEGLLLSGVNREASSMRMIGYRQMLEFLQDEVSYDQMRLNGIAATRQLAKRQLTWLRNQQNLVWWVDYGLRDKNFSALVELIEQYLR